MDNSGLFNTEKRGYCKDEVELYISMLQDGIQSLDNEKSELQRQIAEKERDVQMARDEVAKAARELASYKGKAQDAAKKEAQLAEAKRSARPWRQS